MTTGTTTHDDSALSGHRMSPNASEQPALEQENREGSNEAPMFPVGFHRFHKNKQLNFQLNRWNSLGTARYEDLVAVAQKVTTFEQWIDEMTRQAERAESEGRLENAAYYYRAAEFYTSRGDERKETLYDHFIECFHSAYEDDEIERLEIPYGSSFLPAMRRRPSDQTPKGTIVFHGGFDSFIEEAYPITRYLARAGYDVVAFDGPGQGGARKKYGHVFDHEWEKPVAAVLDHLDLDDVTLLGMSMGGWLALRAASFERRVSRVIAWSVSFDVLQYTNVIGQKLAKLFFERYRGFTNRSMLKKMKKNLEYAWFMNNLMFITGTDSPIEGMDRLIKLNEENLRSGAVEQDVLILTGRKDHAIPFKTHGLQVAALTGARSVTDRVFTKDEQGETHCQIGNFGLALRAMTDWLDGLQADSN